ncbi:hypothetical protein V3C99_006174 [Haemonchus contortus]
MCKPMRLPSRWHTSTRYLVCFSGNARMFNCPAGLVYHGPTTSCEHPSRVPKCRSN